MANKRNLKKILESADKAKRDTFGGWKPADGQKIVFKVTKATQKDDKNNNPAWTLMLTVTKGEDKGKVARCYMGINEEHEFVTQRLIDNFKALGVTTATLWENPDLACEMVLGKTGVATVKHGGNNPSDPILNFHFEGRRVAKKATATKRRKVEDDVDEDDDEEEEETTTTKKRAAKKSTKKAAAKKTTRRKKPKPEPEPEEDDDDDEFEDEDEDDNVFDPDEEDDDDDEELDDEDEWDDEEDDDEWEEEEDD